MYGLESWPQKTDKTGALVRKYCPELKDYPDKVSDCPTPGQQRARSPHLSAYSHSTNVQYIYCPHKAPPDVQKKAKCIIGQDYPFPMLDEHAEKDKCIARLKHAYALGLHGNDKDAMDGTAERKLREQHKADGVSAEDGDEHVGAKSEKEVKEEKGKRKREKEGNGSLDAHFKPESKGKPVSKKVKKEDEETGRHGKGKHGKEVGDEEANGQVKETVQADSEHGAKHQKAEQGDSGRKASNLESKAK